MIDFSELYFKINTEENGKSHDKNDGNCAPICKKEFNFIASFDTLILGQKDIL